MNMDRTNIRSQAQGRAYEEGMNLYQEEAVWEFSIEEDGPYDEIDALVKGGGRSLYQVNITVDVEEGYLEDYDCECQEFAAYRGLCQHCVAVLLEYEDYTKRQKVIKANAAKQHESLKKLQAMQKGVPRHTTPAVKEILSRRAARRQLPYLEQEHLGSVHLMPVLHGYAGDMWVEFKIGISQMYVLRDACSFAERMAKGECFSYGKKLTFHHIEENFAPDSRGYLEFLLKWAEERREEYGPYGYLYGYGSGQRKISLDAYSLEDFLDAVGPDGVRGQIGGENERIWKISETLPKRQLIIRGEQDGIEVEVAPMMGGKTVKYYIFFKDEVIYRIPAEDYDSVQEFVRCVMQSRNRRVYIEKEDVPAFCMHQLPDLKKVFECNFIDFTEQDYGLTPAVFRVYLDLEEGGMITFRVLAVYGEKEYLLYDNQDLSERDLDREMALKNLVNRYTDAYDNQRKIMVLSGDEELTYLLLTEGIAQLQTLAEVFVSESLKRLHMVRSPKVTVGISLSGDLLKLQLTSGEMSRDELMELLSKYHRKKKFYRLKNGDILNVENEEFNELVELREGLQLTDRQLRQSLIDIPRYRILYMEDQLEKSHDLKAIRDEGYRNLIRNMKTVEDNDFVIPPSLVEVLRGYQKTGFLWIKTLKANGFGGILADDMGLGKTIQVIAFLLSEYESMPAGQEKRTLIVTPASLIYNWQCEMERFAPGLKVEVVAGTVQEREQMVQEASDDSILITSYDLLKRDMEFYQNVTFGYEVIDEAQYIKNHGTQAAQAVKDIASEFRLALTGTPIENRLSELWSIFDYLMPGFLHSAHRFREEFENRIIKYKDEQAMERLKKMIRPFVLRRLKKEVLLDLPDKTEENRYVGLKGEQQKLYDAHVQRLKMMLSKESEEDFRRSKIQILAELTRIRQICCDPGLIFEEYRGESEKLEACIQLVQNAVGNGHKVLLFSQFTTMLERLEARLQKEGIRYYSLTGSVSKEKRQQMVGSFQTDETQVFLISLKAGGTGLNLTAADIVIHYDPWWNVAAQNQATDRAHRIGQEHVVNVYKLITKGTIEEKILKLQEQKQELADRLLNGTGAGAAAVSREELLALLS